LEPEKNFHTQTQHTKIKTPLSFAKSRRLLIKLVLIILYGLFSSISCKNSIFTKSPKLNDGKNEKISPATDDMPILDDFSNLNIVLVLGGLDAKGFANIGILSGLEKHKILPSRIIATGMGGLTAAFYSEDTSSFSLEWKHFKLSDKIYFDFSLFQGKTGNIRPTALLNFIEENISAKRVEDLSLPITIVTTDIKTRKTHLIERGNLGKAIYSGIAIPGMFAPIEYRNNVLFTGYLTEGLPIAIAIKKNPDAIIAIDLESGNNNESIKTTNDISFEALKSTGEKLTSFHRNSANIFFIRPDLSSVKSMQFSDKKRIINIGLHTVDSIAIELKKYLSTIKRRKM